MTTSRGAPLPSATRDHGEAARRLERECDFAGAAREALLASDPAWAARLAALGGADDVLGLAVEALVDAGPDASLRAAEDLRARGFARQAGRIHRAAGRHAEAAEAFEAGADALEAAGAFVRAGRPAEGARVLEAALRRTPEDTAARLALGRLLADHGRTEAATRTLQKIPPGAEEHGPALLVLARCLRQLGLELAAREVDAAGARAGVTPRAEPRDDRPAPSSRTGGPARVLGRYAVRAEIAMNAHARVLDAEDELTGERVAVKLFVGGAAGAGRDALLRFEREAKALAELRHPNVVPLRAYVPEGPALVLAWMAGGSLADRLRHTVMAPARAAEITALVLGALGEAHRLGVLHRDVKPSNVLFDEIGTPHLADFGAAHIGDHASTATAGEIGTFAYMAPEQRLGRPATLASDLYGVGALLVEMLRGEPPSPGEDIVGLASAAHPELGPAHDAVLVRMLESDPGGRPADAFEARRLVLDLDWPQIASSRATRTSRPPDAAPLHAAGARLALLPGGSPARRRDTWLARDVLALPLDTEALARARAFARAGHPALPAILRADPAGGELWIAAPEGGPVAVDAPLAGADLERLGEALEALHAAGGAHGQLDAAHLFRDADGAIAIAFPEDVRPDASAEADRDALRALCRRL